MSGVLDEVEVLHSIFDRGLDRFNTPSFQSSIDSANSAFDFHHPEYHLGKILQAVVKSVRSHQRNGFRDAEWISLWVRSQRFSGLFHRITINSNPNFVWLFAIPDSAVGRLACDSIIRELLLK